MGRSVSYPNGSVVAFRLLDDGEDDDVDWVYECLVDEVIDTTKATLPVLGGRFLQLTNGESTALAWPGLG